MGGDRRQLRIRAMEEVKRLISTLGEESVLRATPHTEELLLLFLELSEGQDLKIVSNNSEDFPA